MRVAQSLKDQRAQDGALTLIKISSASFAARKLAWPILMRTLAISIGQLGHFMRLEGLDHPLPTRTLLLAFPVFESFDFSPPLERFNRLSSLALVALGPIFSEGGIMPSNAPSTFSNILGVSSLHHTVTRLSIACHITEELSLDQLHLDRFRRLTHLRLAIQGNIVIPPRFELAPTVHTLSISPAVICAVARVDLPLPALTSLEVLGTDDSSVTWTGDHHSWTVPRPIQIPLEDFAAAFTIFLGNHTSLSAVSIEHVEVSSAVLYAFRLLPDLQNLGLHPKTPSSLSPKTALGYQQALNLFSSDTLPHLTRLLVLHVGNYICPANCHQTREALKKAVPASLRFLAFGPCGVAEHLSLQQCTLDCVPDQFSWASDEEDDITFRTAAEKESTE